MRDEREVKAALDTYGDTVRRICFVHLKNHHDVDDIFQDVFLKYALRDEPFASGAHEKAWLSRVAINACKDVLKSFRRRRVSSLEGLVEEPSYIPDDDKEVLEAVLALPERYRIVVYMFYFEGYTAVEIAQILGKKENTIYTWLTRAKNGLKASLGGDDFA